MQGRIRKLGNALSVPEEEALPLSECGQHPAGTGRARDATHIQKPFGPRSRDRVGNGDPITPTRAILGGRVKKQKLTGVLLYVIDVRNVHFQRKHCRAIRSAQSHVRAKTSRDPGITHVSACACACMCVCMYVCVRVFKCPEKVRVIYDTQPTTNIGHCWGSSDMGHTWE